jgi:nucleoside-diphosphate-sugar epimerase
MRIFITGASGVIGRRVVPLLVEAGHQVTAVGRSPEKLAALAKAGAEPVTLDLFDARGVRRALEGHDAVINLATHMPSSMARMMLPWAWRENDHVRREGSAILVDAAIDAGVARFIQESFAPAYPDRGAAWIDETTPLAPVRYNRSILDAEASAARFAASRDAGVIVRFAAFYGSDAFTLRASADMVRRGWSPLPGSPDAFVSSISHDDAAAAVVAVLDAPSGIYNVSDDEPVTRKDYAAVIADAIGVPHPKHLPGWATRLMGSIGELGSRSERISNQKLRSGTKWWPRFRSVREGLPASLEATYDQAA